jgi:transketolase
VREFGMSHIMNGMALHGGILPFGGTFLMFSEYARNAIRMSALMKQRVIYVFTHDSIGLGEDGPTHQPVEQTATLRMIPNMDVWRPCDTVETMVAWTQAVEKRSGPSALCLSRQNLPFVKRDDAQIAAIAKRRLRPLRSAGQAAQGGDHRHRLGSRPGPQGAGGAGPGRHRRCASSRCPTPTPSTARTSRLRDSVLPKGLPRVAVEAGVTGGWYKYVGLEGAVVGLDRFGESAPAGVLFKEFGFTAENVVKAVKSVL